jgi:type I restriction enzyme, S subunit
MEVIPSSLKTLPDGWELRTIGELASFSGGSQPPRSTFIFQPKDGYIRLIQIRDYKTDEYQSYIPIEHARKTCTDTDIMIGRYGPPIFQILRGIDGAYNVAMLKATPSKDVHPEYLYYFLKSETLLRYIELLSQRSSGQTGVDLPALKNYPFPLPPLPEQRAIAAALSDVDSLLSALDALLAKKRLIKQGTMQELLSGKKRLPGFGGEWKVKTIGEMFQFLATANNPRSELLNDGNIQYIHYGDIHTRWKSFLDCDREKLPFISEQKVRMIPFLEDGDLVMADASEDYSGVGVSVEIKNIRDRKIVAGLHTLLLRGNKKMLADGFKGYMQYIPAFKNGLIKIATGVSVYGVTKGNMTDIAFAIPSIPEQTAIAEILSDMDAEIAALEQRREKTRLLKEGMMQELLTGRIRLV